MRHSVLILIALSALILFTSCGKTVRTSFYVEGNCEACKPIIDEILQDARGVDSAGWDFSTSTAKVAFNLNRTDIDKLQEALAAKGFETQFYPADEAARKQLPACCQEAINRPLSAPTETPHP